MGLAKQGIAFGQKLAVEGLVVPSKTLDPFSEFVFKENAVLGIAHKIIAKEKLTLADIQQTTKLSLNTLLKLAGLKRSAVCLPVRPVVALPLGFWLSHYDIHEVIDLAISSVVNDNFPFLQVAFDSIDLSRLDADVGVVLNKLKAARSGLMFVGPKPEDLIAWVARQQHKTDNSDYINALGQLFGQLFELGFRRFQSTFSAIEELFDLSHQIGFLNTVVTDLNQFSKEKDLTLELFRLNNISGANGLIHVWTAGVRESFHGSNLESYKIRLLRSLALGVLILDNIRFKRASSRYFEAKDLEFAYSAGANDFGLGAINTQAAIQLKIGQFAELRAQTKFLDK